MDNWNYLVDGQTHGPITTSKIVEKIKKEEITVFDLIHKENEDTWRSVLEFEEFQFLVKELKIKLSYAQSEAQSQWVLLVKKPPHRGIGFIQSGPFSTGEITNKISEGEVRLEDLIWREGLKQWVKVNEIQNFSEQHIDLDEVRPEVKISNNIEKDHLVNSQGIIYEFDDDDDDFSKLDLSQTDLDTLDEDKNVNKKNNTPVFKVKDKTSETSNIEKASVNTQKEAEPPLIVQNSIKENKKIKITGPEFFSEDQQLPKPNDAVGEDLVRKNIKNKLFHKDSTPPQKNESSQRDSESQMDTPPKIFSKTEPSKTHLPVNNLGQKNKESKKHSQSSSNIQKNKTSILDSFFDFLNESMDSISELFDLKSNKKYYLYYALGVFLISLSIILWNQREKLYKFNKNLKTNEVTSVDMAPEKIKIILKKLPVSKKAKPQVSKQKKVTKVPPTGLTYLYLSKAHKLLIKTNGSEHFPVKVRLTSILGRTLGIVPLRRYFKLMRKSANKEFILDLEKQGVPRGNYEVQIEAGDLNKEYQMFLGKKGQKYKVKLWEINKKSSYYIIAEKKRLFSITEKLEDSADELKRYYNSFKKSPKSWNKFYNSWKRNLRKSHVSEYKKVSKLYFKDNWQNLKQYRSDLFEVGESLDNSVRTKKYSTQNISRNILSIKALLRKVTAKRL